VAPKLQIIENADETGDKALRKSERRQQACQGVNCWTVLGLSFDIIDSASAVRPQ
jgi:hypothetical protein